MSYILDALKKIEYEKNKRSRQGGRGSVAADLFQERSRPSSKTAIWKFLLLALLVSLATFAGAWFLLQGKNKGKTADAIRPQMTPPAPVAQVNPVPVQPTTPVAVTPVVSTVNTENLDDEEDSVARDGRRKHQMSRQMPKPPVIQTAQAPADIKLSGIAFQDERRARRAIVNGYLLKEGAVVSGARITAIYADRVRFSSSAGQFEIKLDAALPVEVRQ